MSLPEVGVSGDLSILQGSQGEVHVFAEPEDDITVHRHDDTTGMVCDMWSFDILVQFNNVCHLFYLSVWSCALLTVKFEILIFHGW